MTAPPDTDLWALFASAFVSATLFPGGSEVVLGVLAREGGRSVITLLAVASLGNTLGGMSSWWLGWLLARRWPARGLAGARHQQALARLRRWGSPVLFLSWLPVVGDPLCLAAGWLGIRWRPALAWIAAGKVLRYAAVIALADLLPAGFP